VADDLALVVLAAGMARRFGRLKQMEPVGPGGEVVMDYGIHDALRSGFREIVLVVRQETERAIRTHMAEVWPDSRFHYIHQSLDDLPAGYRVAAGREKPWGTAHAVHAAARGLDVPFGVMNADDFYGRASFEVLASGLRGVPHDDQGVLVAFRLSSTLSEHGGVSRAVCEVVGDRLAGLTEYEDIRRTATGVLGQSGGQVQRLDPSALVSMNLWGFNPGLVPDLGSAFTRFLERHVSDPDAEFLLPDAISEFIDAGRCRIGVVESEGVWMGMTYPGDREAVSERIRSLVDAGAYPRRLSGR